MYLFKSLYSHRDNSPELDLGIKTAHECEESSLKNVSAQVPNCFTTTDVCCSSEFTRGESTDFYHLNPALRCSESVLNFRASLFLSL